MALKESVAVPCCAQESSKLEKGSQSQVPCLSEEVIAKTLFCHISEGQTIFTTNLGLSLPLPSKPYLYSENQLIYGAGEKQNSALMMQSMFKVRGDGKAETASNS